jgi:peptidoglycan/xylan/chitin deacetylase (PgdA/CDA1 family)
MTISARDAIRGVAEAALVRTGVVGLARRRLRGRAVVLAYHNIVPTGERRHGEASLHLPQLEFARQLDLIASAAQVMPLSSLFDGETDPEAIRVAITFDDAYVGAVTAGLDELRLRSMPATVFVAPGLLGQDTWWDRLAEWSSGAIPAETRRYAIHELRGDRVRVVEWLERRAMMPATADPLPRIANEAQLTTASQQPGVTFGAHSWFHRNLPALAEAELAEELAPSLAWLRARFANVIPWLTYPYGLSSPTVEAAVSRAQFEGAFMVSGGWMSHSNRRLHALPRLNVPAGLSINGLSLRLAGIASNR